ncbi:unnamed protein product [Miscanthus lutarioriparius]|uniref:RRM domain-containing protein n=1 Tax=Miscanthus lutarioriparius TaxID=422564 RepID=A0A811MWD3_9POAL|nr:unnamed protein product [Miscanthus lutarioriparius]
MAGYRSRSPRRSYSPRRRYSRSPPRRKRYDGPRDRYRWAGAGGGGDRRGYGRPSAQSGLLIRNISLTARPEDIRVPFEQFGPIKDVYLPRNFHTRELRGFGFVKFRYPEDAAVAKQEMNHQVIGGREISIVYAEENRKTPQEMCTRIRTSGRYMEGRYTRRSLSRSPRSRSHWAGDAGMIIPLSTHTLHVLGTTGATGDGFGFEARCCFCDAALMLYQPMVPLWKFAFLFLA